MLCMNIMHLKSLLENFNICIAIMHKNDRDFSKSHGRQNTIVGQTISAIYEWFAEKPKQSVINHPRSVHLQSLELQVQMSL